MALTGASKWTADMNALQASYDSNPGHASFGDSIDNLFTGNKDWERTQLQNAFSASEAEKARHFSKSEAQLVRDWQEQMSNTAYQRAVSDMKKAGLNPALMFSSGGSASTPSGAAASSSQAGAASAYQASGKGFSLLATAMLGLVSQGVSSALGVAKMATQKEIAQIYARARKK